MSRIRMFWCPHSFTVSMIGCDDQCHIEVSCPINQFLYDITKCLNSSNTRIKSSTMSDEVAIGEIYDGEVIVRCIIEQILANFLCFHRWFFRKKPLFIRSKEFIFLPSIGLRIEASKKLGHMNKFIRL